MSKLEEIENNWEGSGYINDIETRWLISRVKELEKYLLEAHDDYRHSTNHQEEHISHLEVRVKELEKRSPAEVKIQHFSIWHPMDGVWFHIEQRQVGDNTVEYYTDGKREIGTGTIKEKENGRNEPGFKTTWEEG
jgi:hypothetical protein